MYHFPTVAELTSMRDVDAPPPPDEVMSHYSELAGKVLSQLPETSQGIADYLTGLGVQGYCGDAKQCALAQHLTEAVPPPEGTRWNVSMSDVILLPRVSTNALLNGTSSLLWTDAAQKYRVRTPDAAKNFIRAFDNGYYPALTKEGVEK